MPGNPPVHDTETDSLLAYLTQQRDGLRFAAYGLTPEQLWQAPTASSLSVGGLLKHVAATERSWIHTMQGDPGFAGEKAYSDTFSRAEGDDRASLLADLDAVAAETEAAVRALPSLDVRVQLPPAPWFPDNPDGFPARWILLHVIEELARHAGQADIIRESIDGATMYELMAGAEGWPETDWLKPWRPADATG